jgi:hypothetical protein
MIQWLLRNNPSLLGDVLEERASGRSRAWYWRQVTVAVARSIIIEGRQHPVLTLRAIATALLVYLGVSIVNAIGYGYLWGYFYPWGAYAEPTTLWFMPLVIIPSVAAGWVMARTHRPCMEAAIVAIALIWVPMEMPAHPWICTGNIVGLLLGAFVDIRRQDAFFSRRSGR